MAQVDKLAPMTKSSQVNSMREISMVKGSSKTAFLKYMVTLCQGN